MCLLFFCPVLGLDAGVWNRIGGGLVQCGHLVRDALDEHRDVVKIQHFVSPGESVVLELLDIARSVLPERVWGVAEDIRGRDDGVDVKLLRRVYERALKPLKPGVAEYCHRIYVNAAGLRAV